MEDVWQTGFCTLKHSHVKYVIQVLFGGSLMAFSMFQIMYSDGDLEVYYSMLSGTLGLFLPAPGIHV